MAKKKKVKQGVTRHNNNTALGGGSPLSSSGIVLSETGKQVHLTENTEKSEVSKSVGETQQPSVSGKVAGRQVDSRNGDQDKPSTSEITPGPDGDPGTSTKISKKGKSRKQRKEKVMSKIEGKINMKRKKIKDPRLIPRMREYLASRTNKNFVSIPLMAEYLQTKYPEYGRKKRSMFVQYVDKAYTYMEKPSFSDPPPPLSDSDENSEKELVAENGHYVWKKVSEHSRDISDVEAGESMDKTANDEETESSEYDEEDPVEYKDTNAMNTSLMNLYKNGPSYASTLPPPGADDRKRKAHDTPDSQEKKQKHDVNVVRYPSPYVMERNLASTGLVGPRRTASDKYFIDRKGENSKTEKDKIGSDLKETREVTIQKFLGNLPSRTSYSAYVTGKNIAQPSGGVLYRVYTGRPESEIKASLAHGGITPENVGVSCQPPKSPSWEVNDVEGVIGEDPRKKEMPKETVSSKDNSEDVVISRKASRTPKKKKSSSRSRKQDESDTDDNKKTKGLTVQKSSVKFEDVGGIEATLLEICKLLVHMRHPEVYQRLGVTPPRGFLLHGPPGCGKTLLANAIAGELDLPMIKIAATEIVSGVSGDSEEKVRDLFDKATQSAPCVMFIDEIDAITPKRETASKDMERRIVAQLLACMDDLNANPTCHVLVIGATNRPDSLDPALRRAGRFDREISLGIPDEQSRHRILQVLCRHLRVTTDFDFGYLARNTPGYVGADLMALAREAAMTAVNRVFQDLQSSLGASNIGPTSATETAVGTAEGTVLGFSDFQSVCNSAGNVTSSTCSLSNASLTSVTTSPVSVQPRGTDPVCSKNNMVLTGSELVVSKNPSTKLTGSALTKDLQNNNVIDSNHEHVWTENNNILKENKKLSAENTVTSVLSIDSELTESTVNTTKHSEHCEMDISGGQIDKLKTASEIQESTAKSGHKGPVTSSYLSVLSWLKDVPPLSETQLADLYITLEDFKEALQCVQPSAKREGFATIPDVTWEDIGALHDIREELELAILAPVRHPEQFKALGLTTAQGVLLAGPPGCGKTLLAKAIANESGINFISVKGPELLNMYVGESEKAVRTVFQRARNSAPCVIFFDELDALCPKRSGSAESSSSARVVNQLLTEMDGLEERKQVFIMAATNRPDIIDPAVLRPGRLDKTLYVGLPSESDRFDILKCITKNGTRPHLAQDVDLLSIAADSRCSCYTGADLAALVREASVATLKQAICKGQTPSNIITVKREHFETAFRKIRPSVTPKDREKYESMKANLLTE